MKKSVGEYLRAHGYEIPSEESSTERDGRGLRYEEWYEERVLGLDTQEYRKAFWNEALTKGRTIGDMPRTRMTLARELGGGYPGAVPGVLIELAILQGVVYPFWVLGRLCARELSRLRRKTYYDRERERRWRLADERLAVQVRRTANPRPSVCQLREAWSTVRSTKGRAHVLAILRCGALLEDLECYVDNHACVKRGIPGICGRAPGIKGLFRQEAQDLFDDYKSVMRCKALVKRYRQAVGCPDPIPPDAILPVQGPPSEVKDAAVTFPAFPFLRDVVALKEWMSAHGNTAYLRKQEWVCRPEGHYTSANCLPPGARNIAAEILAFGGGTLVAVEAAIALRIDPACVEADPNVRVRRLAGGICALQIPRRVREWLRGAVGRRAAGLGSAA